jgi:cell division protein FtsW
VKKAVDTPFLLLVSILVVFGLLIFTSAALGLLARDGASFTSVATGQVLFGLLCGSVVMLVLSRLDYRLWKKWTPYFFAFALFLTMLTLVPHIGVSLKGASRWLSLGPLSFQPQEVLKLAAVALLAAVYATRMREIKTLRASMVPLVSIVGVSAVVLILQPDTAGVMMLCAAAASMLFCAGGRFSYLVALFAVAVLAVLALALYKPYLRARLETYLNPSADAQGSGYQIQQSLIAVGSGGFFGRGFGQSIEKFSYLPEPIGDSIFAVAGEEFGFLGSAVLVLLFAAFAILGLRIAARAPDPFGGLLVVGLTVLIAGQSLMNIASTLGLIPLAGEPLIFVSHGGTALALALAEVGIILSVSRRMRAA